MDDQKRELSNKGENILKMVEEKRKKHEKWLKEDMIYYEDLDDLLAKLEE
jgi:hypothetical protein